MGLEQTILMRDFLYTIQYGIYNLLITYNGKLNALILHLDNDASTVDYIHNTEVQTHLIIVCLFPLNTGATGSNDQEKRCEWQSPNYDVKHTQVCVCVILLIYCMTRCGSNEIS